MAKIDFQNFTIPVGISKKRKQTGDARETIANLAISNMCSQTQTRSKFAMTTCSIKRCATWW